MTNLKCPKCGENSFGALPAFAPSLLAEIDLFVGVEGECWKDECRYVIFLCPMEVAEIIGQHLSDGRSLTNG
jgi:predicted RNA-binding Zn-ribbon protein involved in translation (DUF1610 family)